MTPIRDEVPPSSEAFRAIDRARAVLADPELGSIVAALAAERAERVRAAADAMLWLSQAERSGDPIGRGLAAALLEISGEALRRTCDGGLAADESGGLR